MALVFVLLSLCFFGVFGAETDEMKALFVIEGDSVTLDIKAEIQKDDVIFWRFRDGESSVDEVKTSSQVISDLEVFKDRLRLDSRTGSLTIRDIQTKHSGIYKAQIIGSNVSWKTFSVTVYASLPVPVIARDCYCSSSSSSSAQYCSVLCSVVNVSAASLSWYKGNSLLSSISVSELSSNVSLHLEVEYQDNNTYSCVINNPISNQTTHLDTNTLCQTSSVSNAICCCGSTDAVIQLVLSALVGVATVVVLGFDIISRRVEDKRVKKSTADSH